MRVSFREEEEARSFRHAAGGTEAGKGAVTNSGTRNLEAETIRSKNVERVREAGCIVHRSR